MKTAEEKRATKRAWYKANREKQLAYHRQWAKDHPGAYKAKKRAEYLKARDVRLAKSRAHYAANREKRLAQNKKYYDANRESYAVSRKRSALKRKYGLTLATFQALLVSQGNRCAICKIAEPTKMGWHVDHDHETNEVRGILCAHCNRLLGHARDNPETLRAAIEYLARTPIPPAETTTVAPAPCIPARGGRIVPAHELKEGWRRQTPSFLLLAKGS